MRILHFSNYADLVGGAEVYAQALVSALRERGHQVALFGGSPEREVDTLELRVIRRPEYDSQRLIQDPAALQALKEFLGRFRPDVIHVHNVFSLSLDVLAHLGSSGVPVLQTVHDFQLLCPNSWCVRGDGSACPGGAGAQCFQHGCEKNYPYDAWSVLHTGLAQRLMANATRLALAPSSHLAERLGAHGWKEVRHQPYFVDFPTCRPGLRANHDLLYVGRLQPEKGVEHLLAAMPEILRAVPDTRLTILGRGSQEGSLRLLVRKLQLQSSVRMLPAVPRAELATYYSEAALAVIPSIWSENSPLVIYECLLAGLPVAASRVGGIPELVEDCGLLYSPGSPTELAQAVIRYFRQPQATRTALSARALQRARGFGRKEHLDAIEGHYGKVHGSKAPSSTLDWTSLLPVLHEVGAGRSSTRTAGTPLQSLRSLARTLGLPKFLKS